MTPFALKACIFKRGRRGKTGQLDDSLTPPAMVALRLPGFIAYRRGERGGETEDSPCKERPDALLRISRILPMPLKTFLFQLSLTKEEGGGDRER